MLEVASRTKVKEVWGKQRQTKDCYCSTIGSWILLRDKTKIVVVGIQGKGKGISLFVDTNFSNASASSSKESSPPNIDKHRNELFHIWVVTKHTKIDTLFDIGSQVNLISKEVAKKLNMDTTPYLKPHPLGWVCNDAQLQVTKQCKLRFDITANFIDEVEVDVVPLDICEIVLWSPYLYDRKINIL